MIGLEYSSQVWAITGNLGGGKTLSAVGLAVQSMRRGFYVVSNVTIDIAMVRRMYGKAVAALYSHIDLDDPNFDPFALPTGSPRGSGGGKRVLVILDECAEWFDQYSNAKDVRIQRLWSWLRHSSKRSQDVVLVVQRMEYLNKVVRLLVSRWLIVDDLAVWRVPFLKFKIPFCRDIVMQRVFDRAGKLINGPNYIQKSVWGCFYNTAECLNSDGRQYNTEYSAPYIIGDYPVKSIFCYLTTLLFLLYKCAGGG